MNEIADENKDIGAVGTGGEFLTALAGECAHGGRGSAGKQPYAPPCVKRLGGVERKTSGGAWAHHMECQWTDTPGGSMNGQS